MRLFALFALTFATPALTLAPPDDNQPLDTPKGGNGPCGFVESEVTSLHLIYAMEDRAGWCYVIPGTTYQYKIKAHCSCWFHTHYNCHDGPPIKVSGETPVVSVGNDFLKYRAFTCMKDH